MDRGRPRRRGEPRREGALPLDAGTESTGKSAEQKAFEELPAGHKPKQSLERLGAEEIAEVHRHAYRQAERFEVLPSKDVESLSKVSHSSLPSLEAQHAMPCHARD